MKTRLLKIIFVGITMLNLTTTCLADSKIIEDPVKPISKENWTDIKEVVNVNVLLIENIANNGVTLNAKLGLFQKPVGDDLFEYYFQFQLLSTSPLSTYALSEDATANFKPANDLTVTKLKTVQEINAKIEEGYAAWEVTIKDDKITSLTNIPWRECIAYEINEIYTDKKDNFMTITPFKRIEYQWFLDGYRTDLLGIEPSNLRIATNAIITADISNGSGVISKKLTLSEFKKWVENGGMSAYIKIENNIITEILGIYYV